MGRKRPTPEQIITALREAEVGLARGTSVKLISRELGITEQTYYRWRKEFGGMKVSQARRLKELERENGRLKRAVADLTLDKLIVEEAAEGNFWAPSADDVVWCVYVSSSGRRRGERAGCSGSHARPSAGRGKWRVTRGRSEVISCDSRVDSAATATDASRTCSASRAGG